MAKINPSRDAKKALNFATQFATTAQDWTDLHNALFGMGGKVSQLFPTKEARLAFVKTDEYRQIMQLIDQLRSAKGTPETDWPNGRILVRLPRTVHAALLKEAEQEAVSLNQLIVSKLSLQLRAMV